MPLETGTNAPDITLDNQDGEAVSLSSFRDARNVVVYFYPKDNTPGCTTEAIDFTSMLGDFAAADTVILGISPDSVASHRRFCDKKELGVTLLADPDKVAAEAFGAWGEKKMYGRTFMGIIRSTYLIGKDGTIAVAWPKVRVKGHAAAVLEAAQNLS